MADDSFDLLISRRGDLNWIEDAKRIGRPGSVLLQLNPLQDPVGMPLWNDELPTHLRFTKHTFDFREIVDRSSQLREGASGWALGASGTHEREHERDGERRERQPPPNA